MKNFRLLLSLITQDNDYQLEQAASARLAAQDVGFDLEIVFADGDTITQSTQILKAVQADPALRPNAVILEPAGGTALPQVARAAAQAGVGWGILNSYPSYLAELRGTSRMPIFSVSADHKETGRIQARQFATLLPRGGTVLFIHGPSESIPAKDRAAGTMATLPPNIRTTVLKGQWTQESAQKCVSSWLKLTATSKARIDLVGAQNDAMAIGARKVLQSITNPEERDFWMQMRFTGVDGLPKTGQAWVRDGSLAATVVVPPSAGMAVRLLADGIRNNKTIPELTYTVPESMPSLDRLSATNPAA